MLIIYGAGEFAEVADWYFRENGKRASAFVSSEGGDTLKNRPVLTWEEVKTAFPPKEHDCFVAIGYSKMNTARQEKASEAVYHGYALASYISPKANVCTIDIGLHAFILEHNTIQPFVRVGRNCVIWSGNHIGHHARIGNNVFITSHVVLSGGVEVGDNSFLGVNSCVRDHCKIGSHNIIGMGSVITRDTGPFEVYTAENAKLAKAPANRVHV